MSSYAPKPCAVCGKPIRPGAANCWSCGTVFNTRPCPQCGSSVRTAAAACWFCAAEQPPPGAPAAEASEAIQPTPAPQELAQPQRCPVCGETLPAGAIACRTCGETLDRQSANPRPWDPLFTAPVRQRHRGGTLLTLAVISIFCCGIILGPITLLKATRDLWDMETGRMDPAGKDFTRAAQIIATIATALHVAILYLRLAARI